MYVCLNLKLYDILGHINRHVSYLQKMRISFNYYYYYFFFLHSGYCVTKVIFYFPFFLDIISIVAKITKILVRIPYFKSIVPHIKLKKKKSHINLRKMILKFHYA